MTCLPYGRNARSLLKKGLTYLSFFLLCPQKTSAFEKRSISSAVLQSCSTQAFTYRQLCLHMLPAFALMPHSWLFSFHLNTFPFNAFLLTLIHLLSLGRLRHGLFELHVLIVVGNLMPRDLLFSSPPLFSLLHPGGVLNGNTLLWITQQGAPWLIALLTIY